MLLITNMFPVLQCPFWVGKQFAERWENEKDFILHEKPAGISKQAQMCFCQWEAVISITFQSDRHSACLRSYQYIPSAESCLAPVGFYTTCRCCRTRTAHYTALSYAVFLPTRGKHSSQTHTIYTELVVLLFFD